MLDLRAIDITDPDQAVGALSLLPQSQAAFPDYYRSLLDSKDDVVRVGALCSLIDGKMFPADLRDTAVALSGFGAVRTRVFALLMDEGQISRARDVLAVAFEASDTFAEERLRRQLVGDEAGLAALEGGQFLRDGNIDHLRSAMFHADAAAGWRAAVPWNIRAMMLMPVDGSLAFHLLHFLNEANQLHLLSTAYRIFERRNLFPTTRVIFDATLQLRDGHAEKALQILADLRQPAPIVAVQAFIEELRAKASESLGNYRQAHSFYVKLNETKRNPSIDPQACFRHLKRSETHQFGTLEADPRTDCFTLLGFARSGTTLLENVLDSHPDIEALEEKPSLAMAALFLESQTGKAADGSLGLAARRLYYEDLDKYRSNAGARIVVDKNPMHSAYAGLIKNLFPEKRHIFMIRDPRDVVISCFKQNFVSNNATENFRTVGDTCRLYDFIMSRWFAHFTFDDETVCYVRYDRLVVDFETEIRRILGFLGMDWDPTVLSFAEHAQGRRAITASYQKVRQGLRIGVQTQWRNYGFLFERPEAAPIGKWVDLFGYGAD